MKKLSTALLVLGVLTSASFAQNSDPLGSSSPASYKIADLPADFVGLEIQTTKDNLQSLMLMGMNGMTIRGDENGQTGLTPDVIFQMSNMVWASKDQIMGSADYILCYKLSMSPLEARVGRTPDSLTFRLTYLRRSALIAFTPLPEYSPDSLRQLAKGEVTPTGTVSQRTVTLSNFKQIALGIMMFLADYDDQIPWVESTPQLLDLIQPYVKNREIYKTLNPAGGMIRFNMCLAGTWTTQIENPAETVLLYESMPWADGSRCVAFADGHAKVVNGEEWQRLQPSLNLKLARHGKPLKPGELPPSGGEVRAATKGLVK